MASGSLVTRCTHIAVTWEPLTGSGQTSYTADLTLPKPD